MGYFQAKIESLRLALEALFSNKKRAILTTLGIIIGIIAVTTTMTASNGLGNKFKENAAAIGSDVFYVDRTPWIFNGNFFQFRNRPEITYKQGVRLAEKLPEALVIPYTSSGLDLKYRSETMESSPVIGTTENQTIVINAFPEYGRFITRYDIQYKKNVCVIGSEIKDKLFRDVDPVNKYLKIGRYKFLVVGVMEKRGSASFFGGPNFDRQVFIPVTAFTKYYGDNNRSFEIAVKAPDQDTMEEFKFKVIGEMRKIRGLSPRDSDDFALNSLTTLTNAYNQIMGTIVLIGMVITSISLFVGAIGVMNIMFVSVTERTREIGIRKAIGATKKIILSQFLYEASVICLLGGLIGLLLSYAIAMLINQFLMPATLSLQIVAISLIVSVVVGLVSGIVPALKAAGLNPIDALHYE
ncbi:MAG: ABC transporter permease [Candidatus Marinimicrobia bacterium]|nr:ABC transporter permease [Candidatus Neomarinimicrobiota bacterium]